MLDPRERQFLAGRDHVQSESCRSGDLRFESGQVGDRCEHGHVGAVWPHCRGEVRLDTHAQVRHAAQCTQIGSNLRRIGIDSSHDLHAVAALQAARQFLSQWAHADLNHTDHDCLFRCLYGTW